MEERPKCALPNCERGALLVAFGKLICGECYMNWYRKQLDMGWRDLENAN